MAPQNTARHPKKGPGHVGTVTDTPGGTQVPQDESWYPKTNPGTQRWVLALQHRPGHPKIGPGTWERSRQPQTGIGILDGSWHPKTSPGTPGREPGTPRLVLAATDGSWHSETDSRPSNRPRHPKIDLATPRLVPVPQESLENPKTRPGTPRCGSHHTQIDLSTPISSWHPKTPQAAWDEPSPTPLPLQLSTLPNFQGFIPAASRTPEGGPDPPVPTPPSKRGQWWGLEPPGGDWHWLRLSAEDAWCPVGSWGPPGRGPGWRGDTPRAGLSRSGHGGPPQERGEPPRKGMGSAGLDKGDPPPKIPPGHGQDPPGKGNQPGLGGTPRAGKRGPGGEAQNVRTWDTLPPTSEKGVQLGRKWENTLRRGGPGVSAGLDMRDPQERGRAQLGWTWGPPLGKGGSLGQDLGGHPGRTGNVE